MKKLKPSEQSVLAAIGQLEHGNVHQIGEAAGLARSTVDKAIKALADARLITEYDTGAEPGEGTPTQWQLTGDDASTPIGAGEPRPEHGDSNGESMVDLTADETYDSGQAATSGENDSGETSAAPAGSGDDSEEPFDDNDDDAEDPGFEETGGETGDEDDDGQHREGDEAGTGDDSQPPPQRRPGNRRIMQIAGALSQYPDGATAAELSLDSGVPDSALRFLLGKMVAAKAAIVVEVAQGMPGQWKRGPGRAADIDPHADTTPRCPVCTRAYPTGWFPGQAADHNAPERTTIDANVLRLVGAMSAYPDGATAAQLAADSGFNTEMLGRLLTAMVAADRAEPVNAEDSETDAETLWVFKPGPLNVVDPEPKCAGCGRRKPGSRSSNRTPAGTRREDALGRNVLKDATLQFILARPGIILSPGAIAQALAVELKRDKVSSGAVGNNCRDFAKLGKITLVSKPTPDGKGNWLFAYYPNGDTAASARPAGDGQASGDAQAEPEIATANGEQGTVSV